MTPSASQGVDADFRKSRRKSPGSPPPFAKLPHSLEAERAFIGSVLTAAVSHRPGENMDIRQAMAAARTVVSRDGREFYDLRNQCIWDQMIELDDEGKQADFVLLVQRLTDKNLIEQVGGWAELSDIQDKTIGSEGVYEYGAIVVEKYKLRHLLETCQKIVGEVFANDQTYEALSAKLEKQVASMKVASSGGADHSEMVQEAMAQIEAVWQGDGSITGLPTGLADLDRKTDGMHKGESIVVAAYPGSGKSALALNIAVHNALRGKSVTFYSHEMNPIKMLVRAICAESRVNFFDVRDKTATPEDFERMMRAAMAISKANLRVKNATGWSIDRLRADAKGDRQKHGLDLVCVDYLQLVENKTVENRQEQVAGISSGCKALAMENDVPVLVLSQMNDDGKLRESRTIGQDADSVWKIEPDGKIEPQVQPCRLLIDKGRDCAAGERIKLTFVKKFTRFECASGAEAPEEAAAGDGSATWQP